MARRPGVYGDKAVRAAFREMARIYTRPVNEASRHALQPVLKAARANTPHSSLKKALTLKRDTQAPKTQPTHAVGGDPKNPDSRKLHLLEFGVDAHMIGSIKHPGHAAQPFLTPAYEAHGSDAIKRFGDKLGPALEKQAARLAKKGGGR